MTDPHGEVFCSICGKVIEERDNDVSSRRRPLDEITDPKSQYHEDNMEGGSKVFHKKDAQGNYLSGQNKKFYSRISHPDNYWKTRAENYEVIKKNKCFKEISNLLSKSRLSTDSNLHGEACRMYDIFVKNKISYRKNHTILAVACVYLACINNNYNLSLEKISDIINEDIEKVKRKVKNIEKVCRKNNIKIKNQGLDKIRLIQKEIEKFPNNIFPEKLKRKTMIHFPYEQIENIISSSKKESVASGIINIISRENNINVTTKKIAQVYGISEFSVRSLSKKIQEALGK